MKLYLMSLGAGLLVGIIYALNNVRSPAPPIVALIGLLGIYPCRRADSTAPESVSPAEARGTFVAASGAAAHVRRAAG